jgi:transcriptional regulator with XRE-family HTH domain
MSLGEQIRLLRQQRGWSQQTLSNLIGVTTSVVYRWERGFSAPSYESLVALAGALGCRILIDVDGGRLEELPQPPRK